MVKKRDAFWNKLDLFPSDTNFASNASCCFFSSFCTEKSVSLKACCWDFEMKTNVKQGHVEKMMSKKNSK